VCVRMAQHRTMHACALNQAAERSMHKHMQAQPTPMSHTMSAPCICPFRGLADSASWAAEQTGDQSLC
jgi:hypothetical protein